VDGFRERNVEVLREAQNALNVAFGAILSAYVGNSLAEIDNHAFDHALLGRFFIFVAIFILGLCVGNSVILRGEYKFGALFLGVGAIGAVLAYRSGNGLGFEVVVLRLLAFCWIAALLGSNAILTAINYVRHRNIRR